MPTGYTQKIYDGSDLSLRSYLLEVGKSYDIQVYAEGGEVRHHRVPSKYVAQSYAEAIEEYEAAVKRDDDAWMQAYIDEVNRQDDRFIAHEEKDFDLRERYEDMITKVAAWDPGPDDRLASLKLKALDGLKQSRDFDCCGDKCYYEPTITDDWAEWRDAQLDMLRDGVERTAQRVADDIEVVKSWNTWYDAFWAALPAE